MEKRANNDSLPAKSKIILLSLTIVSIVFLAAVNSTIDDFFLPGSQPGQSGNIEHPDKCDNCHGGYDLSVEPAFNWRGSMMAQAARDPLYFACLAISNQDVPESGDLCIRCHAPDGWLNGRSTPTDGSALNNNDREGVQCDFCHKLVKPTPIGVNPYPQDPDYTANTYLSDQEYLSKLTNIPPTSANGMYIASDANSKRGPFTDAEARHQQLYSPFHQESALCGTCHDVSNPAFSKTSEVDSDGVPIYAPNDFGAAAQNFDPREMFPVERTYSEWLMSDFNSVTGIKVDGFGGNKEFVSTCQDCHMQDVTGYGCNKKGVPLRNDLPLHDMTGGNTFIPGLVAQLFPDEVSIAALDAGVQRATGMLQKAATVQVDTLKTATGYNVTVKVTNNTGHKLPSGYPEGRRIWVNVVALNSSGNVVYENGSYDFNNAEIMYGTSYPTMPTPKIYEIEPGIGENLAPAVDLPIGPSFHFVLNNRIFKDNRIPPRGVTNAELESIQSPVVGYTYPDGQYWDQTTYNIDGREITRFEVRLYYQTLTKEYVTFLRDENRTNEAGNVMYNLWENNGKSAPVIMVEKILDKNGSQGPISMGVSNITVTRVLGKGNKEQAVAEVLITDIDGNPLAGALVNANYSGPTTGSASGITNSDGIALLETRSTRSATGAWCFDITDVTLEDYVYEPTTITSVCDPTAGARIAQVQSVSDQELSNRFTLYQNYPNPFIGETTIRFDVPVDSYVSLQIYDTQGRMVKNLANTKLLRGRYNINWDASNIANGQYILKLLANDVIESKLMLKVN